jgi:hypothetical protein
MVRNLHSAFSRQGKRVPVYIEQQTGNDDFGQPVETWNKVDDVLAFRSYQNRNTTRNSASGELHRDRAVFFFADGAPITGGVRMKYGEEWYELDSPTPHETHTVAVGSQVVEETFNPES